MNATPPGTPDQQHWEQVYAHRALTDVSWFEAEPLWSLAAIKAAALQPSSPIIDVGGGASTLVDELIRLGYRDLTVLDISATVLESVKARLADAARYVELIRQDITQFRPNRTYAVWHDRAVFHFLTTPAAREAYRTALLKATATGSHVAISTFGPQGPLRCSGLDTVRYDAAALVRELGEQFQLINANVDTHTTPSGNAQQFLHARFRRQ